MEPAGSSYPKMKIKKAPNMMSSDGVVRMQNQFLAAPTNVVNPVATERKRVTLTNYDPMDRSQNRLNASAANLGIGAGGVLVKDNMVAVMRNSPDDPTPVLPFGTVLRDTRTGREHIVADLLNARFNRKDMPTVFKVDVATPGSGKTVVPGYQGEADWEIVRMGKGRKDLKEKK